VKLSSVCLFTLLKVVGSKAFKETLNEIAFVVRAITPLELALSILLAIYEFSFIGLCSIVPYLLSSSMLFVVKPLSFILATIQVLEHAITISLVISEVSYVILSIGEYLSSIPMLLVSFELSFILSAILPEHNTYSISLTGLLQAITQHLVIHVLPLSFIGATIFNRYEHIIEGSLLPIVDNQFL
jgi:hypothetical protein